MKDTSKDTLISQHSIGGKFYKLILDNSDDNKFSSIACSKCAFEEDSDGCDVGYKHCEDSKSYFTESTVYSKGHYNGRGEFVIPIQMIEKAKETPQDAKGIKYDDGKIQWWYLPIEPIKEVLKVLHYGDQKYPADDGCNWKQVPEAKKRYYSALMRHVTAWWDGEKNDQESGLHHLAHACTNVLFLLWFEMKGYPEVKSK